MDFSGADLWGDLEEWKEKTRDNKLKEFPFKQCPTNIHKDHSVPPLMSNSPSFNFATTGRAEPKAAGGTQICSEIRNCLIPGCCLLGNSHHWQILPNPASQWEIITLFCDHCATLVEVPASLCCFLEISIPLPKQALRHLEQYLLS